MFRPLLLRFLVVVLVTVFSFSSAMVEAGESEMRHFCLSCQAHGKIWLEIQF